MRRFISLLLTAALLLALLPGCQEDAVFEPSSELSSEPSPETEIKWTAANLSEIAFQLSGFEATDEFEHLYIDHDRERLSTYLENAYKLQGAELLWEDGAVSRGVGASAFEIAVVRMENEGAAVRAATAFMNYISTRQGDFSGYAPAEADMVANGEILQVGPYAALFICPNPVEASAAVEAALKGDSLPEPSEAGGEPSNSGGEPSEAVVPTEAVRPGFDPAYPDRVAFTQPNKDDMSLYDTTSIRAAWGARDPSGLSSYDRDIYAAAEAVLDLVVDEGMSDLEKETALYGWVVDNVNYDWTHQDIMVSTPRESFTPYGGLVNRTAVCLGYATTFQLLCDLAGVECITVVGAAFQSEEDHAWNMVRLDGNWYCVDVTWDANYREQSGFGWPEEFWNHFNITSDEMAADNHQWDYANTPEAVTQGNGRS